MSRTLNYVSTPIGAIIREKISEFKITQEEFSEKMGLPNDYISGLIDGSVSLTMDVASKLEEVLGLPSHFWCNLESKYREKINDANREYAMRVDMELVKNIPYTEMVKNGWVEETENLVEKVLNLRRYFNVEQLTSISENFISRI